MKISIEKPTYGVTPMVIGYINEKIKALADLPGKPISADVKLRHSTGAPGEQCICDVFLKMKDRNIFATQKSSSFEESAGKVVRRLIERSRSAEPDIPQERQ
jgi:ribosome-associated translation inhibitor RaiA